MADEGKKKPARSTIIAVVALICLIIAPLAIMFNDTYAVWRIFTDGRIAELEKIFATDFPENTEFDYYKKVYAFQAGTYHTLYITEIENPENFCKSNVKGATRFMADLSGKEPAVLINNGKYENIDENSFQGEKWHDGEIRHTDFVCVANNDSYYNTIIYFFENDDGSFDVKFIK